MFRAVILDDVVNAIGDRKTTFELEYPRCIHSELLTHRAFSRNSASSRAIPVERLIKRVLDDPFVPLRYGAAQKGMIAGDTLTDNDTLAADAIWLDARDKAISAARALLSMQMHKTMPNRLIEPWMYITVIVSATEWTNFWELRVHPTAEDHFYYLAMLMRVAYLHNTPKELQTGEWSLPLVTDAEKLHELEPWKLSVARCARVSYLTHDGIRDLSEDYRLHDQLLASKHLSPFEHACKAVPLSRSGNFTGFIQYREMALRHAA